MLSDKSNSPVGFEAVEKNEKSLSIANIQTEHVIFESEEVQVVETKSIQTQTVNEPPREPKVDYDRLAEFLKRITPGVLQYLDEQHGSTAFEDYDLGASSSESTTNVQLINRLNSLNMSEFKGKISCLTWSTGGGTLAVGHSAINHSTWCSDITKIELFNVSKDNQLISIPNRTLEVNSCCTNLLYHPEEPSILAAGLFNGDVLVWNLRDETSVMPLYLCTHNDMVSQVYWHLRTFTDSSSALFTAGADGYIYIHRLAVNFTQGSTRKKYKISKEKNPAEKARPPSAGASRDRAAEDGLHITTFDFSSTDHRLLVVGTLCGGLYKCKLDRAVAIEGDENVFDPVIDEYDRHKSTVTCIKSAPTQNLFVSCGSDREVRIYDFDQPASIKVITIENTPVQLNWHFGNRDIFLAYGAGSEVKFFNVKTGRPLSKTMLYSESRENATCLSFNPKREMVAIGDSKGNLEIWRMPRNLSL